MSDAMMTALISAGTSLVITVVTLVANAHIEKGKNKSSIRQKEYQSKRESLREVYKKLIFIVNLYPNTSPTDVLKRIKYPPNYTMESFNSVLNSLDYQIKDDKRLLKNITSNCEQKRHIEMEIFNMEYSKEKIGEIRDKYINARDKYASFCESDKALFDLFAGQEVKNALVEFKVVIHNIFISGYEAESVDNPLNNIDLARRKLINCMRNDIGIQ